VVDGPVSAEVTATDVEGMIREGEKLAKIAKNITIKVPLTWDGLKACKHFTSKGTMVNVTLCFSAAQALLTQAGVTTPINLDMLPFPGIPERGIQNTSFNGNPSLPFSTTEISLIFSPSSLKAPRFFTFGLGRMESVLFTRVASGAN